MYSNLLHICNAVLHFVNAVHIPYFMNTKWTARYRGSRWIDGSFRLGPVACGLGAHRSTVYLDWRHDPAMAGRGSEFLKLHNKAALQVRAV